jgi:5-methylcytosine-specific restriction enzyme subunit McrC
MKTARLILREHAERAFEEAGLSADQAWALVEASEGPKGAGKALSLVDRGRRLKAASVVGVVAIPGAQVEILPKIEVGQDGPEVDLVRMLQTAGNLPLVDGAGAQDWSGARLLDVFARLFLDALAAAARRGLPRAYVREVDDLPVLRGRLDVVRQFSTLAASPERLACAWDEFSLDTPLNRVLRAAVDLLARAGFGDAVRMRARTCAGWFEGVTVLTPARARLETPRIDRTNRRLAELLRLARLFLSGARQTARGGGVDGYTLLFDMNELFERHATEVLRRRHGPEGWTVSAQASGPPLLRRVDGASAFGTRPDIVMRRGDDIWIVDAKWKRLRPDDARSPFGISQGDVYQVLAYARVHRAKRISLLYPHWTGIGGPPGEQARYLVQPDDDVTFTVETLQTPLLGRSRHSMARVA